MIECRGRNGWFNLRHASVVAYKTQDLASVALASKSNYRNVAPIYFQGPKAEVEALLLDLLQKIRAVGDVDLGDEQVIRCVPVAANNRELIYAEQGRAVTLTRLNNGKWVITGLAKSLNSTVHYIYMSFSDDTYAILGKNLRGYVIRPLTYGELGTLVPPYGYGTLPYGVQGKFRADGSFVEIVEWH